MRKNPMQRNGDPWQHGNISMSFHLHKRLLSDQMDVKSAMSVLRGWLQLCSGLVRRQFWHCQYPCF